MSFIMSIIVGMMLVYIIAYTDFILSRQLKNLATELNTACWRGYSFRPFSWPMFVMLSIIFWAPPLFLLEGITILEYKIFITLLGWALISLLLRAYLIKRCERKLATRTLPLLITAAIASGMITAPLFSMLSNFF